MANTSSSANMSLPIPVVGTQSGPQYAININDCLTIIDQHTHTPGSGALITAAALNINADLTINAHNLTSVKSVRMSPQSTTLVGASDLGCIYQVNSDLYYNDGSGTPIRMTQNSAVAGTPGSIANLVSPASASYVSASSTFVFQSDTNTPANIDGGAFIFRNVSASSNGITVQPPNSLSSNYTITLPALPASTLPMTLTAAGQIGTGLIQNNQTQGNSLFPVGGFIPFAGTSAPTGWLFCDGAAVSRTTYATLFSMIGTAWGAGDGSTTFNLPDTRGLFLRGVDGSAGRDPDASSRTAIASGGNIGNNVGSYQNHAFDSHVHGWTGANGGGTFLDPWSYAASGGVTSANTDTNRATTPTGGNETRPRNIYANFIIKT